MWIFLVFELSFRLEMEHSALKSPDGAHSNRVLEFALGGQTFNIWEMGEMDRKDCYTVCRNLKTLTSSLHDNKNYPCSFLLKFFCYLHLEYFHLYTRCDVVGTYMLKLNILTTPLSSHADIDFLTSPFSRHVKTDFIDHALVKPC
jgi:hypothetical protein